MLNRLTNNIANRLLNAKKYAIKNAFYIVPTLGAEIIGLVPYYFNANSFYYYAGLYEQFKQYPHCGEYGVGLTYEIYCRNGEHVEEIIYQGASQYAHDQALTNIYSLTPYLIATSFTASVLGGCYGFIAAPENIHEINLGKTAVARLRNEVSEDAVNANEDMENFPEEFQDPIFYNCMEKPQKLNCDHVFDLTTLRDLQSDANGCIGCPLCRKIITSYTPDTKLQKQIENFLHPKTESMGLFSDDSASQASQDETPSVKAKMA